MRKHRDTFTIELLGIEIEVVAEFTCYPGSPSGYDEPGDPAMVSISRVRGKLSGIDLYDILDEGYREPVVEIGVEYQSRSLPSLDSWFGPETYYHHTQIPRVKVNGISMLQELEEHIEQHMDDYLRPDWDD